MLTDESYQMAWAIYLASALGFLLVVRYWLSSRVGAGLQVTLVLLLAALVLTPSLADPELESYAPAVVVTAFDFLTHGPETVLRSLEPVLLMVLLALALGALFTLISHWVFKSKESQ